MKDKKYILITKDLHNSLIEFLDEIQFDIAGNDDKDSMHKVNFISWAINELINSFEAFFPKKKKSREDYVDETFLDWNLPEMTDEEYNKNSKKKSTKKPKSNSKPKTQSKEKFIPPLEDIAEYMSLEEIK